MKTLYRHWNDCKKFYVKTGEKRKPKKGEYFLSGSIPEAYDCLNDLPTEYFIAREAAWDELYCRECRQFLACNVIK